MLKSQIMSLRKELGKQTPVRIVPHRPIPWPRPEKVSDERTSLVEKLVTASQKDKLPQGSRGPRQLPLPADVSDDFNLFSQSARIIHQLPANSPGPRATEKLFGPLRTPPAGRSFPQGCVLHAPPSAYPQVMPGSLPSTSPDPSQNPIYPPRCGGPVMPSASTSGVFIPKKPSSIDNPPLINMDDDIQAEVSLASVDHDV